MKGLEGGLKAAVKTVIVMRFPELQKTLHGASYCYDGIGSSKGAPNGFKY